MPLIKSYTQDAMQDIHIMHAYSLHTVFIPYSAKLWQWKSLMNLMNGERFIKVFQSSLLAFPMKATVKVSDKLDLSDFHHQSFALYGIHKLHIYYVIFNLRNTIEKYKLPHLQKVGLTLQCMHGDDQDRII